MSSAASEAPHEGQGRPSRGDVAAGATTGIDTSTCSPAAARFDCCAIERAAAKSFASNRVFAASKSSVAWATSRPLTRPCSTAAPPIEARRDRLCRNDRVVRVVLHLVVSLGRSNATVLHLLAKEPGLEIGRDAEGHKEQDNRDDHLVGHRWTRKLGDAIKAFPRVFLG